MKIKYFRIEYEHGQGTGMYYSLQTAMVNVTAETMVVAIQKFNELEATGVYKSSYRILKITEEEISFI